MGPSSTRTNVVVDVSRIDNTRLCNGPTHSFASCVPHAEVGGVVAQIGAEEPPKLLGCF